MKNDHRKQLRLPEFDYGSPGAYFVTVCTADRRETLAEIRRGDPCGRPDVMLSELGAVAESVFPKVEILYGVTFDCTVIMPDHIHFILFLPERRATARVAPTLGQIVGAYKSIVANEWRNMRPAGEITGKLWQRNFYEHVIRNETDLEETRRYIADNPSKWCETHL